MKTKITRLLLSTVLMMCCMVANAVGTQPSGEGTPGNPYQIATKDNLLWFADYVNQGQEHLTACAILTADITVNNGVLDSNGDLNNGTFEIWTPIGSWGSEPNTYKGFAGEFNGGGHTISGLYFNDETKAPVGLFGMADQNGYIHDVGITDSYFRGKSHVAGICGDLGYGRIENCWNAATVQSAEGTTGGIAGSCWKNSSVSGCYNIGKVAEGSYCGGICGSVAKNINGITSVSNCVSLEGKCSVAYNLYDDDAVIDNVTIQNASAFADGTVCGLLKTHSAEFIDGYIPTATTTGRYGHWHCCRCGKDFLDEACTTPATDAALTVPVAKNNEIWYTTTDNKKLTSFMTDGFGATYNDANNVYEKGLGKITFDKDVTSIGEFAFSDCSSLKSISVPNSVNSIGQYAFSECSSLKSISVPNSVTSIGQYAFSDCSSLQSISVPNRVTSIEKSAFSGCSQLQSITIPNSVTSIGKSAFMECSSLQSISVPNSVTSIGEYAFSDCSSLQSISVPNSVTSIGNGAFSDCSSLQSISVPNSVTSIGNGAFRVCSQLQSITIPGSVKSMGSTVFSYCTSLKDVTIEDGAYIGNYAFQNYNGTLTINGSLSGVGGYAFSDCTVLTSVSIKGGDIGKGAFKGCINLGSVTLHDGVTGIGEHAFMECSSLQSISVPNSVTSIGEYAFSDCSSLKSISVPNSVNSIGGYAFKKCSQLQSITIPGSVKSMGWDVFDNCSNLNNVTIEDGAYIGMRVFQNYTGAITINGSLSGVDQKAFDGCTALTSVSVKSGSIVSDAFRGCTGLTSVSLLEGVNSIGAYAFQNCSNLKDIFVKWTKAEEIPSIDKNVFDGVDRAKATLHVPTNTTSLYQAKDIWKDFRIVEDVNFIITKTDDTKIEQKVVDNGSVTIDERNRNIKSLMVTEEVENVSVTYYRNFANAGKWQAWYVPFDVPVADMAQAGLDVAEIYGILLDNDNNAVIAFLKMDAGTVKANTPYVVRPKEYGDVTVTTTTTLYQTKPTQFAINSAKDTYTIGGIYEQTTTPGNWYAVNTSGQFQKMGTGVNLSPMRIWMTIDPRDDNPYTQPSEANAKMNIMVIGDDESTGIESLAPTLSESDGAIYNLQGQRVTSIQKGQVYIMNGKKFFAR